MKKFSTLFKAVSFLVCLFTVQKSAAQWVHSSYGGPTCFSRTYTYLSGGTRLPTVEADDGFASSVPLGFTFKFDGNAGTTNVSSVTVSSNGWLKLGAAGNSYPNNGSLAQLANIAPGVFPLWDNLSGVGGTASYKTDVLTEGTKVFTMEWRNWKWANDATAASISFQVKLYEGSNIIEFCYMQETGTVTRTTSSTQLGTIGLAYSNTYKTPTPVTDADFATLTDPPGAAPVFRAPGAWGGNMSTRPATDQVYQFYKPCSGKPSAGFISEPDSVCANTPFVAKLFGATPSPLPGFGIEYKWQASPDGTTWADIAGASGSTVNTWSFTSGIATDTFLRVIVTCTVSGQKDTTDPKHIKMIVLPYNCYCPSRSTAEFVNVNIGNVKVITAGKDTILNNGVGTPGFINPGPYRNYTLYTGLRPIIELNRDTTYNYSVMAFTRDTYAIAPSGIATYIDYNGNGIYDAASELASFKVVSGTSPTFVDAFTVPTSAALGITGMRVIMKKSATTPADVPPCGTYTEGETEDYIVNIVYPNCPGPITAGTSYITDTSICQDYATTISNTTHARFMSRMHWDWEYSLDNVNWAFLPGSAGQDVMNPVIRQSTYFRLRAICDVSHDTVWSNKVFIKLKQPYKCYCLSYADGGTMDTSDITTVILGSFMMNSGGPHLLNPGSTRMRTDHTDLNPIELVAGRKYPIAVYQTLFGKYHADAKITVFLDYNHNLAYDALAPTSERVWTATTTATNFFIHDSIQIPAAVIPDVATGMRVIVNNNTDPNDPSDMGCGTYTSGETEDYLVIFRRPTTGIGEIKNVDNLQIFPNPSSGNFTVSFSALNGINDATVTVTNTTGQLVFSESFQKLSGTFNKQINMSGQPSGVYFISLEADGQKTISKVVLR
jgi:hypothetical protein